MSKIILLALVVSSSLSLYEFVAVFVARVQSKTKNSARVFVRGVIFLTIIFLFWLYADWKFYIHSFDSYLVENPRIQDTPFLLCAVNIALVFLLVLFEFVGHMRALRKRSTTNKSRLVSGVVILFCLFPVLKDTLAMWDGYVEKLSRGPRVPRSSEGKQ